MPNESPTDQNYLVLRHILDTLEKLTEGVGELRGKAGKIDDLVKSLENVNTTLTSHSEAIAELQFQEKRRVDIKTTYMAPAIQKIVSMSVVAVFLFFSGVMWKSVNHDANNIEKVNGAFD